MTVGVQQQAPSALASEDADRSRAQAIATSRRWRRAVAVILIRVASLIAVLAAWQWFGADINPALFTTPSAIARAAVTMIGSGELWNYLWPSLIVLAIGLLLAGLLDPIADRVGAFAVRRGRLAIGLAALQIGRPRWPRSAPAPRPPWRTGRSGRPGARRAAVATGRSDRPSPPARRRASPRPAARGPAPTHRWR